MFYPLLNPELGHVLAVFLEIVENPIDQVDTFPGVALLGFLADN